MSTKSLARTQELNFAGYPLQETKYFFDLPRPFVCNISSISNVSSERFVSTTRQPPIFILQDLNDEIIDGIYYEQELCPVKKNLSEEVFEIDEILQTKGRGKSKKYFVSWRGYPAKFNSWVLASDLVDI